jgi:response regulator RpfG family c-di-GMP phosphodiesterase
VGTRTRETTDAAARAYRWLAATRQPKAWGPGPEVDRCWQYHVALSRLGALASELQPDDADGRGHADRVGSLSRRLALAIGLTPDEAEIVALAGRLHDIGTIGARGGTDAAEVTRRHSAVGAQLVAPFDVLGVAAPMIRHHHERLDGSGYPDGLRGERIPVGARIIAVADEYDRLTTTTAADAVPASPHAAIAHLVRHARRTLDGTIISALIDWSVP